MSCIEVDWDQRMAEQLRVPRYGLGDVLNLHRDGVAIELHPPEGKYIANRASASGRSALSFLREARFFRQNGR